MGSYGQVPLLVWLENHLIDNEIIYTHPIICITTHLNLDLHLVFIYILQLTRPICHTFLLTKCFEIMIYQHISLINSSSICSQNTSM